MQKHVFVKKLAVGLAILLGVQLSVEAEGEAWRYSADEECPAAYTAVEYLQSAGSEYLDVKLVPDSTTKIVARYMLTKSPGASNKGYVFGEWGDAGRLQFAHQNTGKGFFGFGENAGYDNSTVSLDNTLNVLNTVAYTNGTFQVNGKDKKSLSKWGGTPASLYLFACNGNGSVQSGTYSDGLRIYECTLWNVSPWTEEAEPVRHLHPCLSGATPGMYDEVTRAFYPGSGKFTTGDEVDAAWCRSHQVVVSEPNLLSPQCLRVTLTRAADAVGSITVYSGSTYGGSDAGGWNAQTVVGSFEPGDDLAKTLDVTLSGSEEYVRFYVENLGWSETVVIGALSGKVSLAVVVEPEKTSCRFSAQLIDVGQKLGECSLSYAFAPANKPLPTAVVADDSVVHGDMTVVDLNGLWEWTTYRLVVTLTPKRGGEGLVVEKEFKTEGSVPQRLFDKRVSISFPGYTGAGTLSGFPVLIRLSEETIDGFDYDACAADGADIRFSDADGTPLSHEVDVWNPDGESLIWVKVPTLSATAKIVMVYGCEDADFLARLPVRSQGVWSSYVAVYHLNDDWINSAFQDESAVTNGVHAVSSDALLGGCVTVTNRGPGMLLSWPYARLHDIKVQTVSGWFYPDSATATFRAMTSKADYTETSGFEAIVYSTSSTSSRSLWIRTDESANTVKSATTEALGNGKWMHLAGRFNNTEVSSVINGTVNAKESVKVPVTPNREVKLAVGGMTGENSGNGYAGLIDEVRVRDAASSDDWLANEYESVVNRNYAAFGAAEDTKSASGLPTVTAELGEVGYGFATFSGQVLDCGGDATGCRVSVNYGTAADALDGSVVLGEGVPAGGTFAAKLKSLAAETTYYYELVAENEDGGTVVALSGSFTTAALPEGAGEAPMVACSGVDVDGLTATVNWNLVYPGNGQDSAGVSFVWGYAAGALVYTNVLADAAEPGLSRTAVTLPRSGRLYYYRIIAMNDAGTGESPLGGFTVPTTSPAVNNGPADAPHIAGFSFTKVDGDYAEFEGCVDGIGAGAVSAAVEILISSSNDPLSLTVRLGGVVPTVDGLFGGRIEGLEPGMRYYTSCRAVNDLGRCDALPMTMLTTPAGTVIRNANTQLNLAMDGLFVTVQTPIIDAFGAGTTTFWLYADDGDGVMREVVACPPVAFTELPSVSPLFRFIPDEYGIAHKYQVVCSNSCGAVSWGSASVVSSDFIARDSTVYTWRTENRSGRWDDPGMWRPDNNDMLGRCPNNGGRVRFVDGTDADIELGECELNLAEFLIGGNNMTVKLRGVSTNATKVVISSGFDNRWKSGNAFVFDALDVAFACTPNFAASTTDLNNRMILTNAAHVAMTGGDSSFWGQNFNLTVTGGSLLEGRQNADVRLGSPGSRMVIDDSTMKVGSFAAPSQDEGPVTIVFRGAAPHLYAGKRYGVWQPTSTEWATFEFSLPTESYASAVISPGVTTGVEDSLFGYAGNVPESARVTIRIAKGSYKRGDFPLIYWPKGINTNMFTLVARSGVKYIWSDPVNPSDPTSAPTRLSVKYSPRGLIIFCGFDRAFDWPSVPKEPEPAADYWIGGIDGIYPHLTMYNNEGECGTGAVVPWADRLWVITYGPHCPVGSSSKLYEITPDGRQIIRPESIGGTPADRMIHRETNQLLIGPYVIDADRNVRTVPIAAMPGRLTGAARHLTDPENKVYVATMETGLYELDMRTLAVNTLIRENGKNDGAISSYLQSIGSGWPSGWNTAPQTHVAGYHAKGLASGFGRVFVSNNGEDSDAARSNPFVPSGVLAWWNEPGKDWTQIRRCQFTEVTTVDGIYGNEHPDENPVWALGWDAKSVILAVTENGVDWAYYRLPKGSHTYDGAHGWNTEWPRIRDVGEEWLLATMHGTFWKFPKGFSSAHPDGIRPLSTYLKVIGDFCKWNDRIVFGCDDQAKDAFLGTRALKQNSPKCSISQSNLWFVKPEDLGSFGPPSGEGWVWLDEDVKNGDMSDPFLHAGYGDMRFSFTDGDGQEVPYEFVYEGDWVRVRALANASKVSAHFRYGPARPEPAATWNGVIEVDGDNGEKWQFPNVTGDTRVICVEVATERDLLYVGGVFYELPAENAGGFSVIRPIAIASEPVTKIEAKMGLVYINDQPMALDSLWKNGTAAQAYWLWEDFQNSK